MILTPTPTTSPGIAITLVSIMPQVVVGVGVGIVVHSLFVACEESLNIWSLGRRQHLLGVVAEVPVAHGGHHSEHREIIASLVALTASFVLIVDNVFSNIVVDFFQWVWVSSSPVHGHDDDCSEDDGEDDEDGDEEVEVHVQGREGAHELHVTVLLERLLILEVSRVAKRVKRCHSSLGHAQVLHATGKALANRHELSVDAQTTTELLQVVSAEVQSTNLERSIGIEKVCSLALRSLGGQLALLDVAPARPVVDLQVHRLVAPLDEDRVLLVVGEILVQGAQPGFISQVEEVLQLSVLQLQGHEVSNHRALLGTFDHSVWGWSLIEK